MIFSNSGRSLGVDEDVQQVVCHGFVVGALHVDDHGIALLDAQAHDGQDGACRNRVAAFLGDGDGSAGSGDGLGELCGRTSVDTDGIVDDGGAGCHDGHSFESLLLIVFSVVLFESRAACRAKCIGAPLMITIALFHETQKTFTGCVLRFKACILWAG